MRWLGPMRSLMRRNGGQQAVSYLLFWYIRFVYYTTRWDRVGLTEQEAFYDSQREKGKGCVLMLWHGRIAMIPPMWDIKRWPMITLASAHRDGRIASRTMNLLGFQTVSGSTGQGGTEAMRTLVKALRKGFFICTPPDGPTGPRMRVKSGMVAIAKLGRAQVTLIAYAVKRRIILDSWDRFCVPLPFNRGVVLWDKGFPPPGRDATPEDLEQYRLRLEMALINLTNEADRRMGHNPIPPVP